MKIFELKFSIFMVLFTWVCCNLVCFVLLHLAVCPFDNYIILYVILFQKITAQNAFGLHLIDYMLEMLQKRGELSNFQV